MKRKAAEENDPGSSKNSSDEGDAIAAKAARKAAKKAAKEAAEAALKKAEKKAAKKAAKAAEKKDQGKDEEAETQESKKAAKKAKKSTKLVQEGVTHEEIISGISLNKHNEEISAKSALSKSKKKQEGSDDCGSTDLPPPITSFDSTPFAPPLIAALKKTFASPSPIQAQSWPVAVAGDDLIAVAETGSGKTLGFLLPAFHALAHGLKDQRAGPGPRVLVMAPTRELASQIHAECVKFGAAVQCTSVCLYGGAPIEAQQKALARDNPMVVIATPGRLCDLLNRSSLTLGHVGFVVLDEADRMLDMGFEKQIEQVFGALPSARQTLCFTATWPKAVRKLASKYLRADRLKRAFVGTTADAELEANKKVSQSFIHATDDEKDNKLWEFLSGLADGARVVVFANTKRRVDVCCKTFSAFGSVAVHGDKPQAERDANLLSFVKNEKPLMFATDVAARGLDIKGVTHVVNFDMARDVESYVHRIGRTGRAGEVGASVTFWNPDYDKACTPALCKIARDAGQAVPDWLAKFEGAKAAKQWRVEDAAKALAAVQ